jgi:hypothetical protein
MKRILSGLTLLAALAGCATEPDDPCALSPPGQQNGIYIYDVLFLPVYLLYGITCEGIRALDRHGAFKAPPKGEVQDGVYTPADGSFSVAAPEGLEIREQLAPERDYVFFAPRLARGPVYGVSVDRVLDPEYAALSVDEYAALALKDARFQRLQASDAPLVEAHREELSLDGRPALTVIYSQTAPGAARPQAWYLMYFIKTRKNAAVLSITWPGDCPKCAGGPEQAVRDMDPGLKSFVDSFHLADLVPVR